MLRLTGGIVLGLLPQPALAAGNDGAEIFAVLGAVIFGSLAAIAGYLLGRFLNLASAILIVSILVLSLATWLWSRNVFESTATLSAWLAILAAACVGVLMGRKHSAHYAIRES
jgi:asparagine N-glycosylation enzyme membrane subunit Stt3